MNPRMKQNAWRFELDPRDPDYEAPPTPEQLEEAERMADQQYEAEHVYSS